MERVFPFATIEPWDVKGLETITTRPAIRPDINGSLMSVSHVTIGPRMGTPLHRHDPEESWVVLSGAGVLTVGDEKFEFGADSLMYAPGDTPHQLVNPFDEALEYIAITAPACDFENGVHVIEVFDPGKHL